MNNGMFHPKLNKRLLAVHEGFHVYAVNAFAIRDKARADEEFTNFATREDFPDLIPSGEIWISNKSANREGLFFLANALTSVSERARGRSEETANTRGLEVERTLRERVNGIAFRDGRPHKRVPDSVYIRYYLTLPDEKFPINVWIVNGNLVRSYYKTDYAEGGHGFVYRWVPKNEIWIDDDVHQREIPFIVAHEYVEHRLMRDEKIDYDTAHDICSRVEFQLRKNRGIKRFLASGRRGIKKGDLQRLTAADLFAFVLKNYVNR
jgi:hypothetical protein